VPDHVTAFLATTDGLNLSKAFTKIENSKTRQIIVELVQLGFFLYSCCAQSFRLQDG